MTYLNVETVLPLLAQAGSNQATGGGNPLVIWGVVLIGVALALFLLEIFVPSGGVIGFLSAASLVGGVVMFFQVDTTLGLVSALVALLALPVLIGFAIKIWPDTWMAQILTLKSEPPEVAAEADQQARAARRALLGQRGKALTDLRPVGMCLIDGKREECLANRGLIDAGAEVEVVSVDGMQMKVREVR